VLVSKPKERKCRAWEIKVVNPACKAVGNLDISMDIICFKSEFSDYVGFEGGKINRLSKLALISASGAIREPGSFLQGSQIPAFKNCTCPGAETD